MANVCEPKIIKSLKETQEKIEKVCEIGDKLYLRFDIKVRVEELILKYCDLKYTVIINDQIKTIQKRKSANYIICIYNNTKSFY